MTHESSFILAWHGLIIQKHLMSLFSDLVRRCGIVRKQHASHTCQCASVKAYKMNIGIFEWKGDIVP